MTRDKRDRILGIERKTRDLEIKELRKEKRARDSKKIIKPL